MDAIFIEEYSFFFIIVKNDGMVDNIANMIAKYAKLCIFSGSILIINSENIYYE